MCLDPLLIVLFSKPSLIIVKAQSRSRLFVTVKWKSKNGILEERHMTSPLMSLIARPVPLSFLGPRRVFMDKETQIC